MAARLQAILAHLAGVVPVGVSADSFVSSLLGAGYPGSTASETQLKVGTPGMTEALARSVVDKLATMIRVSANFASPAFRTAYDKAVEGAQKIEGFTKKHPVWSTVIALGILAIMCPPAIKALGFGSKGVAEGEDS